jgi:hypothetical protein
LSAAVGIASETYRVPPGSCGNLWGEGFTAFPDAGSLYNAGDTLSLQAPDRVLVAARNEYGYYDGPFDGVLKPGAYRLENGGGGPGLGPFHADFSLPNIDFSWTNRDQFSFSKPDGLTVSWTVADPSAGHMMIFGSLALDGESSGDALFTCTERSVKGSFTVPWQVLERAGIWSGRFNELRLSVFHSVSTRLDIPGMDFAEFTVLEAQTNLIEVPLLVPAVRR